MTDTDEQDRTASTRPRRPSDPRYCNQVVGCTQKVILVRRFPSGSWTAYEAEDRPPNVPGCHVLVSGQSWTPGDLAEHYRTRFEITEAAARELVEGYPFHRPHHHPREERTP